MSNETSERLTLNTSELREGDVVHEHGMQVLLEGEPKTWTSRNSGEAEPCTVYAFKGRVLNIDKVREERFVPMSFLHDNETGRDDVWVVQGNHLARWAVERKG